MGRAGRGIVSDQQWDPWQQSQGRPQNPPQQPYGQPPYGQQPYQQGQAQYGQPGPGQYPGQPYPGQPYPGQPYGPPGGQQPYPGPGYGYGPQPPRRRKRHPVRAALIGVGALLVVVIVAIAAESGGGNHTVTTGTSGAAAAATSSPSKGAAPETAKIGSTLTLAGNSAGEKMAVTVVRVLRDAQPASQFDSPDSGDRLYAVQFRLTDAGSIAYSDSPSNGAVVVDSAGQSYQSALNDAAGCESFPGTENIATGGSGLGCIVFEVPAKAKITEVQFTLDSGMGPQTGQSDVRA
jgi:uncharacterized protein DUF4352